MSSEVIQTASNDLKSNLQSFPASMTDIGCERQINEDRFAFFNAMQGKFWIVCDGMGGVMGGELAAQLAVENVRKALENSVEDELDKLILEVLREANRTIVLRRSNPAFTGMGTTIVALAISGSQVCIAHVGDSRVYLVRNGQIQQITTDHTYVQELVDKGLITEEESVNHPEAHVLTKCLGSEANLSFEKHNLWVWPSSTNILDKLVLCTDGLYSLVSEDEIAKYVTELNPEDACARLIDLAKANGGFDNITITIVPLAGTLREEELPQSPAVIEDKKAKAKIKEKESLAYKPPKGPSMPLNKLVILMFACAVLGSMIMALLVLLRLIN